MPGIGTGESQSVDFFVFGRIWSRRRADGAGFHLPILSARTAPIATRDQKCRESSIWTDRKKDDAATRERRQEALREQYGNVARAGAKFDRYDTLHSKARTRSEEFFKAIQTRAPEWVHLGTTKTAVVYNFGKQLVASHE